MYSEAHSHSLIFRVSSSSVNAALSLLLARLFLIFLALFLSLTAQPVQGQTYTVIHNFAENDGANPFAGLTMDASGNFYGTTHYLGTYGSGNVFKLRHYTSGWILTPLYSFIGGADGSQPTAGVTVGSNGTLYGTTQLGGLYPCGQPSVYCGVVYNLKPSATVPRSALYSWDETLLHSFTGGPDGGYPNGELTFDRAGNIYGTASWGGYLGYGYHGVVYQLTPSGGGWTDTVLYSPTNNDQGTDPSGGVVLDSSGNLYGVFSSGGPTGAGDVYELSPSGSGWTVQVLYGFPGQNGGGGPIGGLIFDHLGNLYGTTGYGPNPEVFELTPAGGNWNFNLLYTFTNCNGLCGPQDRLAMDAAGNLYGTSYANGTYGMGAVFKLSPSGSGWTYTALHDFCAGGYPCSDGANPISNVVIDVQGNLYGTASLGGTNDYGVVWEITP